MQIQFLTLENARLCVSSCDNLLKYMCRPFHFLNTNRGWGLENDKEN